MFKIVLILAICAAGAYAHKKGYLSQWVEQAQDSAAMNLAPPPKPAPAAPANVWPVHRPPEPVARGPSASENCARARRNVQEMQGWMSQGGSMQNVTQGKKMSENETFDALARNRQYIESNCR
jgi:hypothetical protein